MRINHRLHAFVDLFIFGDGKRINDYEHYCVIHQQLYYIIIFSFSCVY